jgi:hypothetical protein
MKPDYLLNNNSGEVERERNVVGLLVQIIKDEMFWGELLGGKL